MTAEQSEASEAIRMQRLIDATSVTIVRLDPHGRITHVNAAWRAFAQANGGDAATIDGVGLTYITTPATQAVLEVLAGRSESFRCVYPCHSPTELRWFRLEAQRIADEEAVVVTHTDVTDLHVATARLRLTSVVANALAESLAAIDTCKRLIRATCEEFAWDFAAVWTPADDGHLRCAHTWIGPGVDAGPFDEASHRAALESGQELPGRAWAGQSSEWVARLSGDAVGPRERLAAQTGFRTAFAVPLMANTAVFAVLEFHGHIQRGPEPELLTMLVACGAHLGAQLARLRDLEQIEIAEAEKEAVRSASRETEDRFRQVLDAIPDLVLLKGPASRIIWANRAFRTIYGMSTDAMQGMVDAPFAAPDDTLGYVRDDARVFATGQMLVIPEESVTGHDGRVRRYRTVKSPILGDDGHVVMSVGVSHDITERMRLETELRLADRMASVGTLAAGVAHEINTPVQFVNDSIHFLVDAADDVFVLLSKLQEVCRLAAERQPDAALRQAIDAAMVAEEDADVDYLRENIPKAFERSLDGIERISTIVRSMKEFAHPAQREMSATDLNHAIENTLTIARSEYKYVAELETDFGDLPPIACHVNEINQVVLNLVVNAAHAIAEVTGRDGVRHVISVGTRVDGALVEIAVRDTGAGIPEAVGNRVFEQFFTTKEVGKGTGQGLALAWATVVEKHGGELRFESRIGEGTTFFVRLPIAGKAVPDVDGDR